MTLTKAIIRAKRTNDKRLNEERADEFKSTDTLFCVVQFLNEKDRIRMCMTSLKIAKKMCTTKGLCPLYYALTEKLLIKIILNKINLNITHKKLYNPLYYNIFRDKINILQKHCSCQDGCQPDSCIYCSVIHSVRPKCNCQCRCTYTGPLASYYVIDYNRKCMSCILDSNPKHYIGQPYTTEYKPWWGF